MSTILKSLKKLEQEKAAPPYAGPIAAYRGPGSVQLNRGKRRWIQSAWFRRSFIALIILGLGTSSAYFYVQFKGATNNRVDLYNESNDQPQLTAEKSARIPERRVRASTAGDNAENPEHSAGRSIQMPGKKTKPLPETMRRISEGHPNRQSPPGSRTPSAESSTIAGSSPKHRAKASNSSFDQKGAGKSAQTGVRPSPFTRESASKKITAESSLKSKPSSTTAHNKRPKKSSESYDNVPVSKDGSLKVQAIVWSTIPEDRIAVINSHVLHEGDEVDGYTLVAIRADDVVVRKDGGGRWRVLFGRP